MHQLERYQVILNQLSRTFKELENIKVKFYTNSEFQGFCHSISYGDYIYISGK